MSLLLILGDTYSTKGGYSEIRNIASMLEQCCAPYFASDYIKYYKNILKIKEVKH
ncbi:hypothetical protein [Niallia taxi]|uniref:hypothetical protein n=1 Tax=Niallia taxi TaxID=2499688 RepID=UPI003009BC04